MRIKFLNVALGLALTATTMSASAQKKYTEGVVDFTTSMMGQQINAKSYFRADSNAFAFSNGPANIKIITDANSKSMVILGSDSQPR
jgi:ABC-type sulfate transport system substrate-binding protein